MSEQPGFLRSKVRPLARFKKFARAKASCDWVSTPLKLSNRSRDAGDLAESTSIARHWILVALRSIRCSSRHGLRNESLSFSTETDLELDVMKALEDRLIAYKTHPKTLIDLSCTSFALRERLVRALGQHLASDCEARDVLWSSGVQSCL